MKGHNRNRTHNKDQIWINQILRTSRPTQVNRDTKGLGVKMKYRGTKWWLLIIALKTIRRRRAVCNCWRRECRRGISNSVDRTRHLKGRKWDSQKVQVTDHSISMDSRSSNFSMCLSRHERNNRKFLMQKEQNQTIAVLTRIIAKCSIQTRVVTPCKLQMMWCLMASHQTNADKEAI